MADAALCTAHTVTEHGSVKFRLVVAILIGVPVLPGGPAAAQLSQADIEELRARGETEGWTFTLGESEATRYPMDDLCGLIVPKGWRARAPGVSFKRRFDLPARFDLRPYLPPVKSQNGCGSCWAFATVGTFECAMNLKDGVMVDLSEQWLVSCNVETEAPHLLLNGEWGCNGGWFAHGYHQRAPGGTLDECGQSGAVLEEDFPYEHDDLPCNCPYEHRYWIDSWAYVGGEEEIPEVDTIKQAIMLYGPVSAAVYTKRTGFHAYSGGVFNAVKPEDKEVNHAIILVGWDDTMGTDGVWILRNSWGKDWGVDGYMYIEYECSDVGLGACYIEYPGAGQGYSELGPTITKQPVAGTVLLGEPFTLSIEVSGLGALKCEWTKDGTPVGTDADSYTVETATFADTGVYACSVSDLRGSTTSDPVAVQVLAGPFIAEGAPTAGKTALLTLAAVCAFIGALMRRDTKHKA